MNADRDLADRLAATLAEAGEALPYAPAGTVAGVRRRFVRRRRLRAVAAAVAAMLALTVSSIALRPVPAPTATPGGHLRMWTLTDVERNPGLRGCLDDADVPVELSTFDNDTYQQLLASPGAPEQRPDVFENWGGADLGRQAQAGTVADLTDVAGGAADVFLPGVMAGGRVDGRQYGLPVTGTQPIVLFYDKRLFAEAHLSPPRTYAELLTAVDTFRNRKVTPIALAGAARWPALMYLMYLTDRLGGPQVFADIAAGRSGAWRHPAVREAARLTQQLVRRGAFGEPGDALNLETSAATGMLTRGEAAMHLMGSWEYGAQAASDPTFAATGLGWTPFPAVAGGAGDPADLVGVPANYLSVDAGSPYRAEAAQFVARTVTSDAFLDGLLAAGEVPAVRDLEPRLAGRPHAEFARFVHRLAVAAPSFTLAWDQALPRPVASVLLDRTRQLFQLTITPDEFVAAMAATA
ncbi:extracellular solute-binding protein [Nucisporomicrobium flavum]|uniref:extracellular solute-binding protein n=1 Tax=Nucisporomicrobium flavum TaxID=2785915 RepID=UPI003C2B1FE3